MPKFWRYFLIALAAQLPLIAASLVYKPAQLILYFLYLIPFAILGTIVSPAKAGGFGRLHDLFLFSAADPSFLLCRYFCIDRALYSTAIWPLITVECYLDGLATMAPDLRRLVP